MLMAMLVPGVLACVFGWLAFRSRVTGVYLSIITQALTYALLLAFFRNDMGFGGNNGLTDFKDMLGFTAAGRRHPLRPAGGHRALFLCRAVPAGALRRDPSRFGKVLIAVRDAESRTRFLGYRPERYKLVVWVLSAVMAGIGGALYVPQVGIINPERVRARQLDRGGDLGRGRRPRHAGRRDPRRGAGEFRQDLVHRRAAGALAVRAGRAVHLRHPVPAARHHGPVRARAPAGAAERRSTDAVAAAQEATRHERQPTRCSISTASPSASTGSGR